MLYKTWIIDRGMRSSIEISMLKGREWANTKMRIIVWKNGSCYREYSYLVIVKQPCLVYVLLIYIIILTVKTYCMRARFSFLSKQYMFFNRFIYYYYFSIYRYHRSHQCQMTFSRCLVSDIVMLLILILTQDLLWMEQIHLLGYVTFYYGILLQL